jgi:hypothetical protein
VQPPPRSEDVDRAAALLSAQLQIEDVVRKGTYTGSRSGRGISFWGTRTDGNGSFPRSASGLTTYGFWTREADRRQSSRSLPRWTDRAETKDSLGDERSSDSRAYGVVRSPPPKGGRARLWGRLRVELRLKWVPESLRVADRVQYSSSNRKCEEMGAVARAVAADRAAQLHPRAIACVVQRPLDLGVG